MKLTYYDDFAFAGSIKSGIFALNPAAKDPSLLFSIFTAPQRDMSLNGNLLSWPGEYEFGGVAIQLFPLASGELGAKVVAEDVRIVFLPALPAEFTEAEKELIGAVDLLVIHVTDIGGWKKLVEEIDPKALLPVGPHQEKFLVEMGAGNAETTQEFTFTAESLPSEQTLFVKLLAS